MDSAVNEIKLILKKYDSPLVCITFLRFSLRKLAQDRHLDWRRVNQMDWIWSISIVAKPTTNTSFLKQAQQKAQPTLVRSEQINLQ